MSGPRERAARFLARRSLVLQRNPAVRRQALLREFGVDLVLDVGAARGGYAGDLRAFGYTGRIISFEPLAAAFADLETTCAGDPSWTAVNVALGATSGRATINVASNSDSSSLLEMASAHRDAAPAIDITAQEEIEVARLDDLAPTLLPPSRAPYLKLDTQGFERQVLDGGAATVAECVGLQLELSFVPLYEGGMLVDEAISHAYDLGFTLMGIERGFGSSTGQTLQADGVFFRSR